MNELLSRSAFLTSFLLVRQNTWPGWANNLRLLVTVYIAFTIQFRGIAQTFDPAQKAGGPIEYQSEAQEGENFRYAAAQCWLPSQPDKVRGTLCIILHPNGNGKGAMLLKDPVPWQRLAERHGCGLVAISFVETEDLTKRWDEATNGTGRSLRETLDTLAAETGVEALRNGPLLLAGVCAAGQFAYEFASFAPERTIAFVTIGGGKHDIRLVPKAASVPGLFIATPDRGSDAVNNIAVVFKEGRKLSALWGLAFEPIKDYDDGKCSMQVQRYIETVLDYRSDPDRVVPLRSSAGATSTVPEHEIDSWFPHTIKGDQIDSASSLSFVGTPVPIRGSASPKFVNVGSLDLERRETDKAVDIRVVSGPELTPDGIVIPIAPTYLRHRIVRESENIWRVTCSLQPEAFPSGSFRIDVPIRFVKQGRKMLGGISVPFTGRVEGDIRAYPSVVNLGSLPAEKISKAQLGLASRSKKPIKILGVTHVSEPWAKLEHEFATTGSHQTTLSFNPPKELSGHPFAGYFLLKVRSVREETLKIPYFGTIAK